MERSEIISKLCKEAAETTPDLYEKISNAAKAQGLMQSSGAAPFGAGSAANGGGTVKAVAKTASKGKIAAIAAGTLAVLLAVTAVAVPLALDSGNDVGGNGGLGSAEGGSGSDNGDNTVGGGSDSGNDSENGDGTENGGSVGGGNTENGVYNGLKYTLGWDGTYYECAGFATAPASTAVIAAEYDGKPVTHIGSGAFRNCEALTTVTLPESVTWILYNAFDGCGNLENINLENVTNIDSFAFYNCNSLSNITLRADHDKGLTIRDRAFAKTGITEITIPLYTFCEGEVFYGCENLTKATVLGNISEGMFMDCRNLFEVYFEGPIGHSPFSGTSVHEITYGYDIADWNNMVANNNLMDVRWNEGGQIVVVHCKDGDVRAIPD
ncbi:MAG: leucine-rich repeat protein [Clostridia bacterium]|nr:leucine-rich repeat protein [Clostridia bacterium]